MKKYYTSLLTATCLTVSGLIATQQVANAFSIALDGTPSVSGGIYTYNYNVTLNAGESLGTTLPDFIELSGMGGVTGASASSPYQVGTPPPDLISASFNVATPVSASPFSQIFLQVLTVTSTFAPGTINYDAFYNDGLAFTSGTVTGPSTPIPFEFSPGLGLLLLGATLGTRQFLKQRKGQEN